MWRILKWWSIIILLFVVVVVIVNEFSKQRKQSEYGIVTLGIGESHKVRTTSIAYAGMPSDSVFDLYWGKWRFHYPISKKSINKRFMAVFILEVDPEHIKLDIIEHPDIYKSPPKNK